MKSSAFARSLELAKLAARVGIKELRSGDIKSRVEQAALIAKSLSRLKGAAMKAGQLLSLDLNHYFPPEAIEILSQLQNAAVAQPFDQIQSILSTELSTDRFKRIRNLNPEPIGVASIGQVHKAQFEGRDIVLKVQYPGVADSIDSDLKILKSLASSFCQITGRKMDLEPLFSEFRYILEQEVDYSKELNYQKCYGRHLKDIALKGGCKLRAPSVIEELSTQRVLAMNFESGVSLRSWLNTNPSKADREALATAILDLYFNEFFKWGLVQTDPNWGNFLVNGRSGDLEVIVLDFGATRSYTQEFRENYIKLLHFAANRDISGLRTHSVDFGLIDRRESNAAFEALENMLRTAIRPFFAGMSESGAGNSSSKSGPARFDFADESHSLNSQNAAKALAKELVYSPPPYGLVFLHRKLAGVYSILKSLQVHIDVSNYWAMMLNLSGVTR